MSPPPTETSPGRWSGAKVGGATILSFVALLYLGRPVQDQRPPERAPPEQFAEWLD